MARAYPVEPGPNYVGHTAPYEFVNDDAADVHRACGQAAVSSLLVTRGLLPEGVQTLRGVEAAYPPDVFGGWFGTSPAQVRRAAHAHGAAVDHVLGLDGVRAAIAGGGLLLTMIQNDPGWFWSVRGGTHWVLAFGYDDHGLHVTNNNVPVIPWDRFDAQWSSFTPWVIGMHRRALVG